MRINFSENDDDTWVAECSVSWEWPDGSGGYQEFETMEEAEASADALPDGCRVWIGDLMVRHGFLAADDRYDDNGDP